MDKLAVGELIAVVIIVAVASILVRLLIANPMFGAGVNKVSAQLF